MSTTSTIADYIQHNRNLGKRFVAEEAILSAFSRSVGKVPLHGIHPVMITRFVNRDGTSVETIAKKHRVLTGFFRYAVTRCQLKASPMPSLERKRGAASFSRCRTASSSSKVPASPSSRWRQFGFSVVVPGTFGCL